MPSNTPDQQLKQWVIYPPALAALIALVIVIGALRWLAAPTSALGLALAVTLALTWWLLPRLAFKLWRAGDSLHWRWGQLNTGPAGSLKLADIRAVRVASLPDKPTRPVRRLGQAELHGGNFTPELNRGVQIELADGRELWFGLPQPEVFATALRAVAPSLKENHAATGTGQQ